MTSRGRMLAGIVAFEWRYATRRLPFAAAAGLLGLMGFALAATAFGPPELRLNGPWSVTYAVGFLTLVAVFAATLLVAPALLRDVEHRMAEVIDATAVPRRDHLLGRFAGSWLAAATALVAGLAGLVAGAFLVPHDPARLAPFDAVPYLWAFAVIALPGLLLVAAFLFAVAALTRSTPATYVAGVLLYVLYFVAALLAGSPLLAGSGPQPTSGLSLAAVLDPFGITAFLEQTRHWSAAERDARLVPLAGPLLWSRLVCLGVTALALAAALRGFRVRAASGGGRRIADSAPPDARSARVELRPARQGVPGLAAFASCLRLELRGLVRSGPFVALFALWIGYLAIETAQTFRAGELGTALVATGGLLAAEVAGSLPLFGTLFLVFFAAEMVWRERLVRVAEVVDATPASSLVFCGAKLAALAVALLALAASALVAASLFQVATGTLDLAPRAWATLLAVTLWPLLLLAVLVVLIQTLAPQRHVGLVLALAAIVFFHRGALGGPEHPLLRYAWAPRLAWSDLSGLVPPASSLTGLAVYWGAIAVLLGLVAWGAWRRGTEPRLAWRLAAIPQRWGRGGKLAAVAAGAVALGAAAFAARGRSPLGRYESEAELLAWKVAYERTYRPLAALAQPVVEHLEGAAELEPAERRVRFRGSYRLANRTPAPMPAVWVVVRRDVRVESLALAGNAPAEVDARFGTFRFALAPPLAPGAAADLAFDLVLERRGPGADGGEPDLVANGSYLHGLAVLPTIGYRRSYEVADAAERRRAGLPARQEDEEESEADLPAAAECMTFDVAVVTPADQHAVAPGVRVDSAVADGRRTTRFRASQPVSAYFAIAAARYAVERVHYAGVDVEVYFHPAHRRNVPRILEAATRALDLCVARYGPYPLPQLRIAEVPAAALREAGGFALPGLVLLSERRAFLLDADAPGRIDLLAKRVAHEVAHQWWGHQLDPIPGPGAAALVETLARHSELRVLAALRGPEQPRRVLAHELERYLEGRTRGDEVPLAEVGNQAYLYYAKGALAMAALVEIAGEAAVDGALRELLAETSALDSVATARDLVAKLLAATPAEHRALVEDWWTRVVLHDLTAEAATATRLPDGRYRVDLAIAARKAEVKRGGAEEPVPFDAAVEVRLLAEASDAGREEPAVLYAGAHRAGELAALSLRVDGRPATVEIDPRHLLLDRNRADNLRRIEIRDGGMTPDTHPSAGRR